MKKLNRGSQATRLLLCAGLSLWATLSACSFSFDRAGELEPGDVQGIAVDENDVPLSFARVTVEGTTRIQHTDQSGNFLIRALPAGSWALRVVQDQDGDGYPERSRVQGIRLRYGDIGETSDVGGLSLGKVVVRPVASVQGTVILPETDDARSEARVVAVRRFENDAQTTDEGSASQSFNETLASESAVGTAGGAFAFPALAEGRVQLVAEYVDPESNEKLFAESEIIELAPGARVEGLNLTLLAPLELSRRAIVHISPEPDEGALVKVELRTPGSTTAIVTPGPLNLGDPDVFSYSGPITIEDVPPGTQDIIAYTENSSAFSPKRTIPPGDEVTTFHVELRSVHPCSDRDCDDDDVQALCRYGEVCDNLTLCATQCQDAFGSAAQTITCTQEGETFDCDDDGDGQPDTTEPPACLGALLGTDLDGDGICSSVDVVPQCAQNFDPICQSDPAPQPIQPPPFVGYSENLPPTISPPDGVLIGPNLLQAVTQEGVSQDFELSFINISDPEDERVSVVLPRAITDAGGSVSVTGGDDATSAVIRYTPPVNLVVDAFDFVLSDGVNRVVFTLRVVLEEADLAPDAADDVFEGEFLEDESITLNILANDTGADEIDPTSVVFEDVPEGFVVTANEEGLMSAQGPLNFFGEVPTFRYTVASVSGARSEPANIDLGQVTNVDDPLGLTLNNIVIPPAREDEPVTLDLAPGVSEVDGENVFYFASVPAEDGSVTMEGAQAIYTPAPDLIGPVTLTIVYTTPSSERAEGPLTIELAAVNDPPRAKVTSLGANQDASIAYSFDDIFEDIDSAGFEVEIVSAEPSLNASIDPTARELIVAPSEQGSFDVVLRATDTGQAVEQTEATITIVVGAPDQPIAVADVFGAGGEINEGDPMVPLDVLGNDINSDDVSTLVVENNLDAAIGVLLVVGTTIDYVPAQNYNGTFTFEYFSRDLDGFESSTVTVTVTVTAQNDVEELQAQSVGNTEGDGDLAFDAASVVTTDVDGEQRLYTIGPIDVPFGTLVVAGAPDNSLATFIPTDENACGIVDVPVAIEFVGDATRESIITIDIACVNDDFPTLDEVAIGPFFANQVTPVTFDVLANEDAANVDVGEELTVVIDGVVNGTLNSALNERNVSVQIDPQFVGTVTVSYTVSDGEFSDNAQLTFDVEPSGALPLATDVTMTQVGGVDIEEDRADFAIDVAAGDFDPDGEPLSWSFDFTGVPAETATLTSDTGSIVNVELAANFCGSFTFEKEVIAGARRSEPDAVVTVVVECVDDPLQANPVNVSLDEDDGVASYDVSSGVVDVDGDALTYSFEFSLAEETGAGTFNHVGGASSTLEYTPAADFCGSFSVGYTVNDGIAPAGSAFIFEVVCFDDNPEGVNDGPFTLNGSDTYPQFIDILGNDVDIDQVGFDTPITLDGTEPSFVSIENDQVRIDTPDAFGLFSFDYNGDDTRGFPFSATVTLDIIDDNQAPIAASDSLVTFTEDQVAPMILDVVANDFDDQPNSELVLSFEGTPPQFMTINANTFELQAPPDFFIGAQTFSYRITDAGGLSAVTTASYEVTPVNDRPIANPDTFDIFAPTETGLGDPVNFVVAGNDTDVDIGDTLTVTNVNCQDPEIVATVLAPAEVTVAIFDGAVGTFTCTYDLFDGFELAVPQGTLTLNVLAPPPDQTLTLFAGTSQTIDLSASSGPTLSVDPALSGIAPQLAGETVDYSSPLGFVGRDSFKYKRSIVGSNDGEGEVSVQVLTPPHPTTETFTASGATPTGTGLPFYGMAAGMVGGNPFAFGGTNGLDFSNASQEFIGTSWSSAIALTPPSPRAFMASTPSQGGFMIYGGQLDDASFSDELWEFSASAWNQLTPTGTAPPKLRGASMVQFEFNATTMTLLMGGEMDNGQINQDIYLLQQNTWEIIFPDTTAFFRSDASLVRISDDPFNGSPRFMYSGGYDGFGPSSQNDLFTFDEFSPGQFQINVGFIGTLPVATIGHQVVPDPNNTTPPLNYILLGGMSRKGFAGESRAKGEVYEITDPAGNGFWVPSSHLMQKTAFGAAIARTSDVLLVGGDLTLAEQDFQNDTLHISLEHDITVTQAVNGTSPPPRDGAAMAEVPGGVVLVGGRGATDILNDVWRYSSASQQWTQLANAPFQVRDMAIARNPVDGLVYGHGGFDGGNANNDKTWVFDPATNLWTEVLSANGPLIGGAQMVHSPGLNAMLMYGGGEIGDGGLEGDFNTYRFDLTLNTWTTINTSFPDQGRGDHNLVAGDMDTGHYILLLNGILNDAGFTEVFRFNETLLAWELQTVGGNLPPQIFKAVMAYDPTTTRFVLHSGAQEPGGSQLTNHKGTYELQEGTGPNDLEFAERIFMRASPPNNPEWRAGASIAFDGEGLLIFGGRGLDFSSNF